MSFHTNRGIWMLKADYVGICRNGKFTYSFSAESSKKRLALWRSYTKTFVAYRNAQLCFKPISTTVMASRNSSAEKFPGGIQIPNLSWLEVLDGCS